MIDSILMAAMWAAGTTTTRNDLDFAFAQEAFVRATMPNAGPPKAIRSVIDQAGDNEWCCREAASKRLRSVEARWAMWGLFSTDPEVKVRCNNALKAMTRCRDCLGTGRCRFVQLKRNTTWSQCAKCGQSEWGHGLENFDEACFCKSCRGALVLWTHPAFSMR